MCSRLFSRKCQMPVVFCRKTGYYVNKGNVREFHAPMEKMGCPMRSGILAVAAALAVLLTSCSRAPLSDKELVYVSADDRMESGGSLISGQSSAVPAGAASAGRSDGASSAAVSSAPSGSVLSSGNGEPSAREAASSSSGGPSRAANSSSSSQGSQNSQGSQPRTEPVLSLSEAVNEVNAAIARTASAESEFFEFAVTLQKSGTTTTQRGTVSYNNNAGTPVFTRRTQFDMPGGLTGETDYIYDGRKLVCQYHTPTGDQASTIPYDASQLPVYVMSLTPPLSAGSLSSCRVWEDAEGLHLEAADADSTAYAQVFPIAGISSSGATLTGITIRYTVGLAGTISASSQTFGITADGSAQTYRLDKSYS